MVKIGSVVFELTWGRKWKLCCYSAEIVRYSFIWQTGVLKRIGISQLWFQQVNRQSFLPRDSYAKRVAAYMPSSCVCPSVCVCLCVCVSVTLRYCIKTAKRRITQITPHDSAVTLVFRHQSSRRNSNGITPYRGDKCRWGGLNFVTFDENAV